MGDEDSLHNHHGACRNFFSPKNYSIVAAPINPEVSLISKGRPMPVAVRSRGPLREPCSVPLKSIAAADGSLWKLRDIDLDYGRSPNFDAVGN